MYIFNPIYNKSPVGPSKINKTVEYVLKISKHINSTAVFFCFYKDYCENNIQKLEMTKKSINRFKDYDVYSLSTVFKEVGLYWYYFEVKQGEHTFYLQNNNFEVEPTGEPLQKFQQLVYEKENPVDDNIKSGVMYHIFVDRFNRLGKIVPHSDLILRDDWGGDITKNSTNFNVINKECFGGNLRGVTKKLDYLASLGVTILYLSPIFEANSYHKYDTADYSKIDSMFGSENDLQILIDSAKVRGISIILDGVFNHTGDDSKYFNKYGRYDTIGAYQDRQSPYYEWYDFKDYPKKYSSWWGIESLPEINGQSQSFTEYIAGDNGILSKYMKMGLLGFRLDVVDEIDEKRLDKICLQIRKSRQDALIVGEVWEDASNKIAYDKRRKYFLGNELNSVMNYPLKDGIIDYLKTKDAKRLKNIFFMLKDHYPKEVQKSLMNILGTHDTDRIMSVAKDISGGDTSIATSLFKIASLIQFFADGIPCIFYGDEKGVEGVGAPYCRVCYPWGKVNTDLQNWYKFLAKVRKESVFISGELEISTLGSEVLVMKRQSKKGKILVFINPTNVYVTVGTTDRLKNYETGEFCGNELSIRPFGWAVLKED